MLIPVLQSIWYSFVHAGTSDLTLDNYREVFDKSTFNEAFTNTLGITTGVTLEMVIGMGIAVMLRASSGVDGLPHNRITAAGCSNPGCRCRHALLRGLQWLPQPNPDDLNIIDIPSTGSNLAGAAWWYRVGGCVEGIAAGGADPAGRARVFRRMFTKLPVSMAPVGGEVHSPYPLTDALDHDGVDSRSIDAFRIFDIAMVLAGQSVPVMSSFVYFEYAARNECGIGCGGDPVTHDRCVVRCLYMFLVERRSEVDR